MCPLKQSRFVALSFGFAIECITTNHMILMDIRLMQEGYIKTTVVQLPIAMVVSIAQCLMILIVQRTKTCMKGTIMVFALKVLIRNLLFFCRLALNPIIYPARNYITLGVLLKQRIAPDIGGHEASTQKHLLHRRFLGDCLMTLPYLMEVSS